MFLLWSTKDQSPKLICPKEIISFLPALLYSFKQTFIIEGIVLGPRDEQMDIACFFIFVITVKLKRHECV